MGNDSGGRVRTLRTASMASRRPTWPRPSACRRLPVPHRGGPSADGCRPWPSGWLENLGIDVEQPTTGAPADAHEDLRLKLAFAELSLRNGDQGARSCREFASALERARSLPMNRFADEAT